METHGGYIERNRARVGTDSGDGLMSGSKAGYEKAREKLLQRYGGEEGLKEHQRLIGAKGGFTVTDKSTKRGFGSLTHEKLVEIASKGGKSRANRD
jgi:hypothetical protein